MLTKINSLSSLPPQEVLLRIFSRPYLRESLLPLFFLDGVVPTPCKVASAMTICISIECYALGECMAEHTFTWSAILVFWSSRECPDRQGILAFTITLHNTKSVDDKGVLLEHTTIEPNAALKLPTQWTDKNLLDNPFYISLVLERNSVVDVALQVESHHEVDGPVD